MRIAAYNVNGINGRLANLLGWLEEATPDIVCLQELKAPDEKFSAAAIRAAGYGAIWHGQKSWYGVAILARGAEPIAVRPLDPVILPARGRHAPIEESGSHMTCMGLFLSSGSLFGAEKPFFIPSPAIQFPERAEGVKGPKR